MPLADSFAFASLVRALSALSLFDLLAFALAGLALHVFLAELPGRIAAGRGHRDAAAVRVAGWLGLPTEVV